MGRKEKMTELFSFIATTNRSSTLYQKFSAALSEFLESIDHEKFLAVLVCGSFARNMIKADSDIDILLVLPPMSIEREDFREVLCSGVQIQLFASTEADLNAAFDWERNTLNRQRSSLVSHGVVVSGDKSLANGIVQKARAAMEASPPSMDLQNAKSMINFIDNQFPKSMENLFKNSTSGFLMTWNGMMDRYFNLIHQRESKLLPRHHDMDSDLSSIDDRELGRAFSAALTATDLLEKKRLFFELSALVKNRLQAFIEANS